MKHMTLIIVIAIAASMCLCVFAAPTKSSVAARHLVNSGASVSAKDYVQNGLVAIYDGIENAGWGSHDSAATSWMNLVNGNTVTLPAGFTAGDDCVTVTNANQSLVVSDYSGADFTVEYVFALADDNTFRECLFEATSGNSSFRYRAGANIDDFWNWGHYAKILFPRSGNVGVVKSISSSWHDIFSATNGGEDFVNGISVGAGSLETYTDITALNGFRIGRNGFTTFQDVCSIRIYNRALTAAEVVANYAIDKERFGLP